MRAYSPIRNVVIRPQIVLHPSRSKFGGSSSICAQWFFCHNQGFLQYRRWSILPSLIQRSFELLCQGVCVIVVHSLPQLQQRIEESVLCRPHFLRCPVWYRDLHRIPCALVPPRFCAERSRNLCDTLRAVMTTSRDHKLLRSFS